MTSDDDANQNLGFMGVTDLFAMGWQSAELLYAGFTEQDLKDAGVSDTEYAAAQETVDAYMQHKTANTEDDPKKSAAGTIVGVVIAILVVGMLIAFFVLRRKQNGDATGHYAIASKAPNSFSNPAYGQIITAAPAGTLPSWADPFIPFMSRSEAEIKIGTLGMNNGTYVLRQSTSTVSGYVISSCNEGKFSNTQIKRGQDGGLYYGSIRAGNTIQDVITMLQSSLMITANNGGPSYYLSSAGGAAAAATAAAPSLADKMKAMADSEA